MFEVVENENLAVDGRKLAECIVQSLGATDGTGLVEGRGARIRDLGVGRIANPAATPVFIDACVSCDAENPGREPVFRVVPIEVPHHLEEGVLGCVACVLFVAEHSKTERVDPPSVLPDDPRTCLSISGLSRENSCIFASSAFVQL